MLTQLKKKIADGDRLNAAEGKFLFSLPLPVLGELATMVKKRFHQENIATFVVDININLTNVCQARMRFLRVLRQTGQSTRIYSEYRGDIG